MKKDAEIKVRIPSEVKKQATELYDTLGLSMSAAIELFLRESIREGGLPLKLRIKPSTIKMRSEDGHTVWPAEEYYEGDDIYDELYPRS